MNPTDDQWMLHALDLARRGTGAVSPNPRVGCVIVNNGIVLAEGWHAQYGGLHAEAHALQKLTSPLPNSAVMYVTLEPCNHHGKQPPCSEAILHAGAQTVFVGTQDPYPEVNGKGLARLRGQGVTVVVGIQQEACQWINRWFFKHATSGLPYVIVKLAHSADGFVAPDPPRRMQLTGDETTTVVHALRAEVDAVVVGVGTVLADDPQLTVRAVAGRDPIRVVIDIEADIPQTSFVMKNAGSTRTIVVSSADADSTRLQQIAMAGAEVILVERTGVGLDLHAVLRELGRRGIASILCESGPTLATAILSAGLCDELRLHEAPSTMHQGLALPPAQHWQSMTLHSTAKSGRDVLRTYVASTP